MKEFNELTLKDLEELNTKLEIFFRKYGRLISLSFFVLFMLLTISFAVYVYDAHFKFVEIARSPCDYIMDYCFYQG